MPRGGKRAGAGRKRGSATKKTREVADRAAAADVTPLEVMLQAMRAHLAAKRLDEAAAIAKDAAPYVHPRLSSTTLSGSVEGQLVIKKVIVRADDAEPGGNGTAARPAGGVLPV